MTQEQLQEKLESVGIKGEWVDKDEVGFSRTFRFEIDGQVFNIDWYINYSTLMVGNVHYWFDNISTWSGYPHHGKWIEFIFRNDHALHVKVGE